jgi:hypothetical protein
MPPDQFAYWNTDDAGRVMIRALIRSGHIDCLHSYGDLAVSRAHAGKALVELNRLDGRLEVWIDHAVAPSNFGADIMRGSGDVPSSPVYHADLTCDYGIRFVWRGRVTSVIGQDARRSLAGVFQSRHPWRSSVTLGKEWMKGVLGRYGSVKYAVHAPNAVCCPGRLRDGRSVIEFLRSNPYWGGVEHAATADGIASVLTRNTLNCLVAREGCCILYAHLGKIHGYEEPFHSRTQAALALLAEYFHSGRILVTTTRRLLGYLHTARQCEAHMFHRGDQSHIQIDSPHSAIQRIGHPGTPDLDGMTFYVQQPDPMRVFVNGQEVTEIQRNPPDHTGRSSISLPWRRLSFPDLS